jgi:hypothetical protein
MRTNRLDDRRRDVRRDRSLVDDRHVGLDDDPAVERGRRPVHLERVYEHAHTARRAPARDREEDTAFV